MGALDWQVLFLLTTVFGVEVPSTPFTPLEPCGRSFLLSVGSVVRLSLCFLAGLSPYMYMVWAARDAPPFSWGNTATWNGFWHHFLRSEYGTFQLYLGTDARSDQFVLAMKYYVYDVVVEQGLYASAIPAVVGLVGYRRKLRSVSVIIGNPLGILRRVTVVSDAPGRTPQCWLRLVQLFSSPFTWSCSTCFPTCRLTQSRSILASTNASGCRSVRRPRLSSACHLMLYSQNTAPTRRLRRQRTAAAPPARDRNGSARAVGTQFSANSQPNLIFFFWVGVGSSVVSERLDRRFRQSHIIPAIFVAFIALQASKLPCAEWTLPAPST